MTRPSLSLSGFYASVTLLTLLDYAVVTAIVWMSLAVTHSTVPLGLVLCLSVALPFAFERLMIRQRWQLSMKRLMEVRIAVFLAVALLAAAGIASQLAGFLLLALAVGIMDFLTVSVFESRNAQCVVEGRISANHAARAMQTAVQLGGFGGAFLGGKLFEVLGGSDFLSVAGAVIATVSLLLRLSNSEALGTARRADTETAHGSAAAGEAPEHPAPVGTAGLKLGRNPVTALLLGLGLIGFHIGAFNSMLPLTYREVNGWDATSFGLASAVAGLGAFLAASVSALPGNRIVVAALLVVADALLVYSGRYEVSCAAAFVLGFLTNLLRIHLRERLIALARTPDDASWIGSRSAYAALSLQALSPLLLSLLASNAVLSPAASRWLLVACGAAVLVGMSAMDVVFGANRTGSAALLTEPTEATSE